MPPALIPSDEGEEEDYNSEEDEDFRPDDAPAEIEAEESEDSDDEDEANVGAEGGVKENGTAKEKDKEAGKGKGVKRKRADEEGEAEDLGFENSGDEAIIDRGLKKKRRRKNGRKGDIEDEEGGEGGVVRTRSMRAAEKIERKPLATTATSTIDVDALFQSMISGVPLPSQDPTIPTPSPLAPSKSIPQSPTTSRLQTQGERRSPSTTLSDGPDSMILIKRNYKFAGKLHTEQKLVPRNSAEAQLYLSTLPQPSAKSKTGKSEEVEETATSTNENETQTNLPPKKRPLKLARRSIFEPTPLDSLPKRTDLHFGTNRLDSGVKLVDIAGKEGKKLNTVEKSAMDWAGFVDKEGLKDELVLAGKSKGAFKERKAFLERVEGRREGEERRRRGLA